MNGDVIRGIIIWVSRHITAKPKEYKKGNYVDHAGIGGRNMLLPGEVSNYTIYSLRSQQRP